MDKPTILSKLADFFGIDSINFVTLLNPPPAGDNSARAISSGWAAAQFAGVVGLSRNAKMFITAASSTATFTADEVIVQTALGGLRACAASVNATIDLTKTGAGGMDAGTPVASGQLAIYLIMTAAGAKSLLAVNASTAAQPEIYGGSNMPSGYIYSALVAVVPTNSSSQFAMAIVRGRSVTIPTSQQIQTSNVTSWTALVMGCPKNATRVKLALRAYESTSGSAAILNVAADSGGNFGATSAMSAVGSTTAQDQNDVDLDLITPQTLYYTTATTGAHYINLKGWDF